MGMYLVGYNMKYFLLFRCIWEKNNNNDRESDFAYLLQCSSTESERTEQIVVGHERSGDSNDNHGPFWEKENWLPAKYVW